MTITELISLCRSGFHKVWKLGRVISSSLLKLTRTPDDRFFSCAFEQGGMGIVLLSERGHLVRANRKFCEWLLYSSDVLIKRNFENAIHPDDLDKFREFRDSLLNGTKEAEVCSLRCFRSDGVVLCLEFTASIVRATPGDSRCLMAFVQDVSQRQAQEAIWKESVERFRQLSENIREAFWILDLHEQRFIYFSAASEAVYGLPMETLRTFGDDEAWAMIHPDDQPVAKAILHEIQTSGVEGMAQFRITKQGKTAWLSARAFPVRDEAGLVYRIVGITEDITERKLHDEEREKLIADLDLERARLDSMLVHAPVGFAFFDRELRYVRINDYLARSNGLPPETHLGRKVTEILAYESERVESSMKQVFDTGIALADLEYTSEIRLRPGIQHHWLSGIFPVITNAGKIPLVGVVALETTELKNMSEELRKAVEAAESASRSKSQFLANMSHEIRTPLNAILGFSELITDEQLSSLQRQRYITSIQRNAQSLAHLIDDILDLSKVEAGRLIIQKDVTSLRELLDEVVSLFEERAREKDIRIEVQTAENLPERILIDSNRLRQILSNIVGNAIKFTDHGSVSLIVRVLEPGSDKDVKIEFVIRDTGVGISEEQQARIFQPFTQADASTSRRYGGTGLGLVLSRHLAQLLGGGLYLLESRPGCGSVFSIQIVGEVPSGDTEVHALEPSRPPKTDRVRLNGLNILVAEDAPDNQLYLQCVLHNAGIELDIAENGNEVLRKIHEKAYDIILMDMQMPFMDGYETTSELRSLGWRMPIIALTAHAMKEDRERCLKIGCNEYLSKPIKPSQLLATIAQFAETVEAP
ncbi:PAS domain S-box protein [Oligoflexus tunisiensis]|uniref:PAS domain S-box protein n=1 Tax=Oligoflexus tunisiensis TaxID=708132 RepID=UPI000A6C2F73|nr:PAS domain S-box protein [Oligoflexus tunisiensis]